jgi:proteasome assembly chaperone 2
VGQLAADLLVSSMGSERVGYLDDPYVLPCVGNDAYGPIPQGDLALPLEGFIYFSASIIIIFLKILFLWSTMVPFNPCS